LDKINAYRRSAGGSRLSKANEYRANAAECRRRAECTENAPEKHMWRDMSVRAPVLGELHGHPHELPAILFELRFKPPRIGEQMPTPPDNKLKSYSHFYAHCSVTAKAQAKYTRRQNVERYRRLFKSATDKERQDYLNRLILEEQQKQKDAGDSDYQY
jgi:hypothetical protein